MKYDKKEPETMDADPMRLLVSAILAFTVMLFINGFVGSMGGFPAFVAFTLIFFRIRTRAGMENGGMQQELSDRQITGRLLWKYAAGYLVLWGILRIAFLISRVTGWEISMELPQWNMYGRCGTHRFWKNGHIFLRG